MAFKTLARCNNPMKPVSKSSLSTQSLQPKAVPDPNLKWIGTGSEGSRRPMGPKKCPYFTGKERATHSQAAAVCNRWESLGNGDEHHTRDQ